MDLGIKHCSAKIVFLGGAFKASGMVEKKSKFGLASNDSDQSLDLN